jgi:hypothetical protein
MPTFKSVQQILGELVEDYLSRLDTSGIAPNLSSLKPGSSLLAFLEAVALTHGRTSQDLLQTLNNNDIDKMPKELLLQLGKIEGVSLQGSRPSTGFVDFSDSRYTKINSSLYTSIPAPIRGVTTIAITSGISFPSSGQIYIGRGTTRLEGPISYTTKTLVSDHYELTIPTGIQVNHVITDDVILAQGGDRTIPRGQVVGVSQGNLQTATWFSTAQEAVILDGETEVLNVPVRCQVPGIIGNASAGSITALQTPVFTGLSVTNPNPFSDGCEIETLDHYRQRIKSVRGNRSKATPGIISSLLFGLQAPDEPSAISYISQTSALSGTKIYIDNGSAYEASRTGIAYEVLIDSAIGGETELFLQQGRPLSKAFLQSIIGPFVISAGGSLSVAVGGLTTTHYFQSSNYVNLNQASVLEIVADINANTQLNWQTSSANNATCVVLNAKYDNNEDLQIVDTLDLDQSTVFGFVSHPVYSVRLYKNGELLYKDGIVPTIYSNSKFDWSAISAPASLIIDVDGTGENTYWFNDADFVAQGGVRVSELETLETWVDVLNSKIPGITATVSGNQLCIVSNLGADNRGSLTINNESTLVLSNMFDVDSISLGKTSDYTLDFGRGSIQLAQPLVVGDKITAGTLNARGHVTASMDAPVTVADNSGAVWFAVDGDTTLIEHELQPSHTLTLSYGAYVPVKRFTASDTNTTDPVYPFINVNRNDWFVMVDPDLWTVSPGITPIGAWRVINVDKDGQWFEIDSDAVDAVTDANVGTAYASVFFTRSKAAPQRVDFTLGSMYTALDVVNTINSAVKGATAELQSNDSIKVYTNKVDGDIAVIGFSASVTDLGFTKIANDSLSSHVPMVVSNNSDVGTPYCFVDGFVSDFDLGTNSVAIVDKDGFAINNDNTIYTGTMPSLTWLRPLTDFNGGSIRGNSNAGLTMNTVVLPPFEETVFTVDGFYDSPSYNASSSGYGADRLIRTDGYRFGPKSILSVKITNTDNDTVVDIPMYRRLVPDDSVPYGTQIKLLDGDNALGVVFGDDFDFSNMVLSSRPKTITDATDNTKSALWRQQNTLNTYGGGLEYKLPLAPAQAVSTLVSSTGVIEINLPSGADRGFAADVDYTPNVTKFRATVKSGSVYVESGWKGCTLQRAGSTVTCTPVSNGSTDFGWYSLGEVVYLTSTDQVNFPSGYKTIIDFNTTYFRYTEAGTTSGPTSYPNNTISYGTLPINFTNKVTAGDVVYFSGSGSAGIDEGSWVVRTVTSTCFTIDALDNNVPDHTSTEWYVAESGCLLFYPLDQSTSGDGSTSITTTWLVDAVNDLTNPLVLGTVLGTGAGLITESTKEQDVTYAFSDGRWIIASSVYSEIDNNYTFTCKHDVYFTNDDWGNEELWLVPVTAQNVVDWLNLSSISNLSAFDCVAELINDRKVQLSVDQTGQSSLIQVLTSNTNKYSTNVYGIAGSETLDIIDCITVNVPRNNDLLDILTQGDTVALYNNITRKVPFWLAYDFMDVTSTDGWVTVSSNLIDVTWWEFARSPIYGGTSYIDKCGNLACLTYTEVDDVFATDVNNGDVLQLLPSIGNWTRGGDGLHTHTNGASAYLSDDEIIFVGGGGETQYVDKYTISTKTWTNLTNYPIAITFSSAVTLQDGRVLVSGGYKAIPSKACYIYDPVAATWTPTASLPDYRKDHAMVCMSDGKVLCIGGTTLSGLSWTPTKVVYRFNPAGNGGVGNWETMGGQLVENAVLPVIISYGNDQLAVISKTVQHMLNYNYVQWTSVTLDQDRSYSSAIQLSDSSVLICGGYDGVASKTHGSSIIYNLTTRSIDSTARMGWGRYLSDSVILSDGRVVNGGGYNVSGVITGATEIFDPTTNIWTFIAGQHSHSNVGRNSLLVEDELVHSIVCMLRDGTPLLSTYWLDLSHSINAQNLGTYKIVAHGDNTLWFENPDAVSDVGNYNIIIFNQTDKWSQLENDRIYVNTTALGVDAVGGWTVGAFDLTNPDTIYLNGFPDILSPVSLGTEVKNVMVYSNTLERLLFPIYYVADQPADDLIKLYLRNTDISTMYNNLYLRFGSNYGTQVELMNRLDFPTTSVSGIDAYNKYTGLIAEANKVLYGDNLDTITYPGIIASGQHVDILPVNVRRIQLQLAIRTKTNTTNIINRVQSAVAQCVNGFGSNVIPYSEIIKAAHVDGVISVVIESPVYNSTNDALKVAANEVPRIINATNDIHVSILGD